MFAQGRSERGYRCLAGGVASACTWLWIAAASAAAPAPPRTFEEAVAADADLNDVYFRDAEHGWAVGDRGVLWKSTDGGERWERVATGLNLALRSISFADAEYGWAVGGGFQPSIDGSQSALLRTTDGGQTWQNVRQATLPRLSRVQCFDRRTVIAIGEATPLAPSGIFITEDGGRSWRPLSGHLATHDRTGHFIDPFNGAVGGALGTFGMVRRRELSASRTSVGGLAGIHCLRLDALGRGWAVGDGGRIFMTANAGQDWAIPGGGVPTSTMQHFDFRAIATVGSHVWIAGSPGSVVFHSPDGGQTWEGLATGQPLGIRGLHFADTERGWAVGELGTILKTADGGATWTRVRAGGERFAVLGIYPDSAGLPFEVFARLAGADGYLASAVIVNRADAASSWRGDWAGRVAEAVETTGGAGAVTVWNFPVFDPGLGVDGAAAQVTWDRVNDGQAVERLRERLVRTIRQLRPDVLLIPAASTEGHDVDSLVSHMVIDAAGAAADATSYPSQLVEARLEPWSVAKIFGQLPGERFGDVQLNVSQLAPRLGGSLEEVGDAARAILRRDSTSIPNSYCFRLERTTLARDVAVRDFMTGIASSPGGGSRRQLPFDQGANDVERLRRLARRQRNARAIFTATDDTALDAAPLVARVDTLTEGLSGRRRTRLLTRLGESLASQGKWEEAAEVYERAAMEQGDDPHAASALVWLVQYYASGEVSWQLQSRQRVRATAPTAGGQAALGQVADDGRVASLPSTAVRATDELAFDRQQIDHRWAKAVDAAMRLQQIQPTLVEAPAVGIPLAVAYRAEGIPARADRYLLGLRTRLPQSDPWWQFVSGEHWFSNPEGIAPRPVGAARRAAVKPRLDGRFDDDVWRTADRLDLRSATADDGGPAAIVSLAYDETFLYLAASCQKHMAVDYVGAREPRQHDQADASRDRVEVYLDVDRDGVTAYRLTIDSTGAPGEACWVSDAWNPEWYIAAEQDASDWRVEAAIPLSELSGELPQPGSVWAVSAQRVIPGMYVQSFSVPAAVAVRLEGSGFLRFE